MPESEANGAIQRPTRPFPWVCPRCRKKEVRLARIPYQSERLVDGRLVAVDIPDLEVPTCGICGEIVFNYAADERILEAAKAAALAKAAS